MDHYDELFERRNDPKEWNCLSLEQRRIIDQWYTNEQKKIEGKSFFSVVPLASWIGYFICCVESNEWYFLPLMIIAAVFLQWMVQQACSSVYQSWIYRRGDSKLSLAILYILTSVICLSALAFLFAYANNQA